MKGRHFLSHILHGIFHHAFASFVAYHFGLITFGLFSRKKRRFCLVQMHKVLPTPIRIEHFQIINDSRGLCRAKSLCLLFERKKIHYFILIGLNEFCNGWSFNWNFSAPGEFKGKTIQMTKCILFNVLVWFLLMNTDTYNNWYILLANGILIASSYTQVHPRCISSLLLLKPRPLWMQTGFSCQR